jgi:hypothetical protein
MQNVPRPVVTAWKAIAPHKAPSRALNTGGWENTPPTMYTSQAKPISSGTLPAIIHTNFIPFSFLLPHLVSWLVFCSPRWLQGLSSGSQGLKDQPQGQHRKHPMNPVPCQDQGIET